MGNSSCPSARSITYLLLTARHILKVSAFTEKGKPMITRAVGAIMNAVNDAIRPGVCINEVPVRPPRILKASGRL